MKIPKRIITVINLGGTAGAGGFNLLTESVEVHERYSTHTLTRLVMQIPGAVIHHRMVCAKQSAEVDEADRERLADEIMACEGTAVLVFHGTNTIHITHKFLSEHAGVQKAIKDRGLVICVVGSRAPLSFSESDLHWNLPYAVGCAEHSEPGVYAVVHSTSFDVDTYYLGADGMIQLKE